MLGLLFARSPATIVRRVWAVVIDAINRQIVGIAIGECPIAEGLEVVPLSTDGDASATIILPVGVGRREAAASHVLPDAIGTCMPVALGCAVLDGVLALTTTVRASSLSQGIARYFALDAAIASAQPVDDILSSPAVGLTEHRPTTETAIYDIGNWSGHGTPLVRLLGQVAGSALMRRPAAHFIGTCADVR